LCNESVTLGRSQFALPTRSCGDRAAPHLAMKFDLDNKSLVLDSPYVLGKQLIK
jgi:hypothetical protein